MYKRVLKIHFKKQMKGFCHEQKNYYKTSKHKFILYKLNNNIFGDCFEKVFFIDFYYTSKRVMSFMYNKWKRMEIFKPMNIQILCLQMQ
jgi:hypothetical protein